MNLFTSIRERRAAAERARVYPRQSAFHWAVTPEGEGLDIWQVTRENADCGCPAVAVAQERGRVEVSDLEWALTELAADYATLTGRRGPAHYLLDLHDDPRRVARVFEQSLDLTDRYGDAPPPDQPAE